LAVLLACGREAAVPDNGAPGEQEDDGGTSEPDAATSSTSTATITLMTLPIGDGKYKASPAVGYIYSCQTNFSNQAPGAFRDGPWIHADQGTFDFTAKAVVQGSVAWPAHSLSVEVSGATRTVKTAGLPDHTTGTFPIAPTDPAYSYDRNPNSIKSVSRSWALPANPTARAAPTCLGMGPIGILLTGAVFFNALDAGGRDAVAHETQDACQAHPEMTGAYHYHSLTQCLADPGEGHSTLLGYARDGFGIYGVRGEDGKPLTNADLDECHGHAHAIEWNGATVSMYHYHATYEYPYTLGCFKGTPINP
jgi:hypothetical protein